jgi:hypothetical protein
VPFKKFSCNEEINASFCEFFLRSQNNYTFPEKKSLWMHFWIRKTDADETERFLMPSL